MSVEKYLDRVHVSRRIISSRGARLSKIQFYRMSQMVAVHESCPEIGFYGGDFGRDDHYFNAGVFQMPSLVCAVHNLDRFCRMTVDGADMRIVSNDGGLWLVYSSVADQLKIDRWVVNQMTINVLVKTLRLVAGEEWQPTEIAVIDGPESIGGVQEIPGYDGLQKIHYHFGWMGVKFPVEFLSLPIRKPDLKGMAQSALSYEWTAYDFTSSLRGLIECHLLGGKLLGFRQAADICGVSERTLHRRLAQGGVNYRELVNYIRFDKARELLIREPDMKVRTIAHLLGYPRLNSFVRAFKNMSGLTPSEFRLGQKDPSFMVATALG
ncbi:AraC family transcriptional regulator [Verrucomicrobiaceae bacterium N1E253]|uniref:AraC family transcriptional regulator n=1 Tax=Oceaniferula marina TaxID=2748318 RepID=A0A851GEE5_9BACT|nr:helix-turn-helix domain-containing protein [Oceaniferula marina]NWK56128.1 AraC family transcriptional regulator [Oceaniferula marina]